MTADKNGFHVSVEAEIGHALAGRANDHLLAHRPIGALGGEGTLSLPRRSV